MRKILNFKPIRVFIYIFLLSLCLFLCLKIFEKYGADICYESSRDLIKKGKYEAALKKANCAIEKNPEEPHYHLGRAKVYLLLNTEYDMGNKVNALKDLLFAEKLNPKNLVIIRNSIPLYYFLAVNDYGESAHIDNIDSQFINIVIDYYSKVKNTYAHDVGVITLISRYESKLYLEKNYDESVEMISELRPDLLDWYVTW